MDAIDELLEECGNFDKAMADLRDAAAIKITELRKALADWQSDYNSLVRDTIELKQQLVDTKHDFQDAQNCSRTLMDEKVLLLAKVAEANRLLNRQAEEYAVYGIQPPKDLLSWLEATK
jgi:chromosome segregation ATPase